jgi:hypothetical protein
LFNSSINYFQGFTSALLTNGTSLCNGSSSNLALNTGNINITLQPGEEAWVLNDFNLTEGVIREYSPIAINIQGKSKHITSTINENLSILVIADLGDCDLKDLVTYKTDSGITQTWQGNEATKICNQFKAGVILTVEKSSSSNIISWEDGTSTLGRAMLQILIILLGLIILIVVLSFTYSYAKENFDNIKLEDFVKYGIAVLLILILDIALMVYISSII